MGVSFGNIQVAGVPSVAELVDWLEQNERDAVVSRDPDHGYYVVFDDCFRDDDDQLELTEALGAAFGRAILFSLWDSSSLIVAANDGESSARLFVEEGESTWEGTWDAFGFDSTELEKMVSASDLDVVVASMAEQLGIEELERVMYDYETWEEVFDDDEVLETGELEAQAVKPAAEPKPRTGPPVIVDVNLANSAGSVKLADNTPYRFRVRLLNRGSSFTGLHVRMWSFARSLVTLPPVAATVHGGAVAFELQDDGAWTADLPGQFDDEIVFHVEGACYAATNGIAYMRVTPHDFPQSKSNRLTVSLRRRADPV